AVMDWRRVGFFERPEGGSCEAIKRATTALQVFFGKTRKKGSEGKMRLRLGNCIFLIPKLSLGNALVFETLLRLRVTPPFASAPGKLELPGQVRSQAGA